MDSFFYALFDSDSHQVIKAGRSNLPFVLPEVEPHIEHTTYALWSAGYTLIPITEYDQTHIPLFMVAATGRYQDDSYQYKSEVLERFGVRLCYAIPEGQLQAINDEHQSEQIVHVLSALTRSIPKDEKKGIYVLLLGTKCMIIAYAEDRLYTCSTFHQVSAVSLLYYLSLAQQTYPALVSTPIKLCGDVIKGDSCHQLISKYHSVEVLDEFYLFKCINICGS